MVPSFPLLSLSFSPLPSLSSLLSLTLPLLLPYFSFSLTLPSLMLSSFSLTLPPSLFFRNRLPTIQLVALRSQLSSGVWSRAPVNIVFGAF